MLPPYPAAMGFGRQRPPSRLLVARSMVYLEAGVLLIWDGWSLLFALSGGGAQAGLNLGGLFDHQEIGGGGLLLLAVLQLLIAGALVYLDREASAAPDTHRRRMTAVQVAYAVYMVGLVSSGVGDWLFGPILAALVIVLHWWPELDRALLGSYPAGAATPGAAAPGAGGTATGGDAAPRAPQGLLPFAVAGPTPLAGPATASTESGAPPEVPTPAKAPTGDGAAG